MTAKTYSCLKCDGRCLIPFLDSKTPLFSRELLRPLRLASLAVGIALLIAGSIWTPSADWDIPLCFVMALPTYVLAPWTFRQMWYFRWKWMALAGLALWVSLDGTYTLYWWLRGFDALQVFRPANFSYCLPLFWVCGFVWNIDYSKIRLRWKCKLDEIGEHYERHLMFAFRTVSVVLLIMMLSTLVGFVFGFFNLHAKSNAANEIPTGIRTELNLPKCGQEKNDAR